jgi:HAE1 family hydrophobic/amphiphilic exporter-1
MIVVFVAVLVGTVRMYGIVPKGFIPDQDNDQLYVNLQAAQGTSFYDMSAGALRAAEIIRQNPNVDSFVMNLGGNNYNGGGGSSMQMPVQLLPRAQRKLSAQQDRAAAPAAVAAVPELPWVREDSPGAADRLRPGQQQLQRDRPERRHRPAVHLGAAPQHGHGDQGP